MVQKLIAGHIGNWNTRPATRHVVTWKSAAKRTGHTDRSVRRYVVFCTLSLMMLPETDSNKSHDVVLQVHACATLLCGPRSKMTYNVSSGTLNSTIPYRIVCLSVRLSVCPTSTPNSRTKTCRKIKLKLH